MIEVALKSSDSLYLSVSVFEVEKPRAVIQIIHGARDHKERYYELISWLNANHFNVVISDIRGHGKSLNAEYTLGYMDNLPQLIDDQKKITEFIKNKYPNLKLYMFAHSLGALLARIYLENYDAEIEKLVLSGPPNFDDNISLGLKMGKVSLKLKGKKGTSDILQEYVHLNKTNWICRNEEVMKKYLEDPLCKIEYSNQAMMTIFNANQELHKFSNFHCANPNLQILCVSGEKDPSTGGEKGLNDTIESLKTIGYQSIENIVYPDCLNEIYNESCQEQVMYDIIKFYLK